MSAASPFIIDAHTQAQQSLASDPAQSAWVSANAGAGKTFVLSRRVVRLLLEDNDPSKILCLTFTKAAAGEMAIRVFDILGKWAVLPENELREALSEVQGQYPTRLQISRARTLFARALETPGGLKIQTIHAFCEALLHQFPLEANIPGNFTVMDDPMKADLMAQSHRAVVSKAALEPDSTVGIAFLRMLNFATDTAIEKALDEVVKRRDALGDWLARVGGAVGAERQARQRFQYSDQEKASDLASLAVDQCCFDQATLQEIEALGTVSEKATDQGLASRVREFLQSSKQDPIGRMEALEAIFLTSGKPRTFRGFATKVLKDVFPNLEQQLADEGQRLIDARGRIKTLILIEQSSALFEIAEAMIGGYRKLKRDRGLLDFDDLVSRTADLLGRSSASAWVLYKLDWGIDHILLDEAQDTSPTQWKIISSLVSEFFSGQTSRKSSRTVFAVGDEKQSIYSFQGARPESFAKQRDQFRKEATGAKRPFEPASLALSFRSTQDVLTGVDAVFGIPENAQGISFDGSYSDHTAARKNEPGHIDVWPLVQSPAIDAPQEWYEPVDQFSTQHQAVLLANKIADRIGEMVLGERLEATGKPIEASDIIVLVRARDRFASALTRALKDRQVPVAGADRLALTDHIAIMDLMALGQVMLSPEDDLSLATILKSPLFGFSEEQLLNLSQSRFQPKFEISLFEALRARADEAPFEQAYERLIAWRGRADALPVYEFYARLLGVDGGRKQFYARLGTEAEDVLDAFLALALSHEQSGLPGLQAFLENIASEQPQIKRELDKTAGEVRVMTVHAAKGLEAAIVFLVDKCSRAFQESHAPALYQWGDTNDFGYLWVPASRDHGDATIPLKAFEKQQAEEEYRRLLYVGMTRAKDQLIVCGYCGANAPSAPNWHQMVSHALESSELGDWNEHLDDDSALKFHRWILKDRPIANPAHHKGEASVDRQAKDPLPAWAHQHLPKEPGLPRPLNPSGAQALIDEGLAEEKTIPSLLLQRENRDQMPDTDSDVSTQNPRVRGTLIHRLLQVLPALSHEDRWPMGERFLQKTMPNYSSLMRDEILSSVQKTIEAPELSDYFDPVLSWAEIPIMGKIQLKSGLRPVSGTIDRLAVTENTAVLIDFKTGAHVPRTLEEVPQDYVTQMALYRHLVARLYPEKEVTAMLVWTHTGGDPVLSYLPEAMLEASFSQIAGL